MRPGYTLACYTGNLNFSRTALKTLAVILPAWFYSRFYAERLFSIIISIIYREFETRQPHTIVAEHAYHYKIGSLLKNSETSIRHSITAPTTPRRAADKFFGPAARLRRLKFTGAPPPTL